MSFFTNLEAYWKFNDDGLDSSGQGRDLTETGTVPFATALFGNGADFPGTNSNYWARAGNDTEFDLGAGNAAFGISLWVDADSLSDFMDIVEKGNASNEGWTFETRADGRVFFGGWGGGGNVVSAIGALSTGAGLQHILATSDGSTLYLYVDGTQTTDTASAIAVSTQPIRIGNRNGNDNPFDGVVDEVAIWSRYLTPEEVAFLFNGGVGRELNAPQGIRGRQLNIDGPLPQFAVTVATLPSAAGKTGHTIFVSDEAGGSIPAVSDGTNWRRVTDDAVVS